MDKHLTFIFLTMCVFIITSERSPFTYANGSTISFYPKFSSTRLNGVVNLTCSFQTGTPIVMTRNDTGSLLLVCENSSCISLPTGQTITSWSFIADNIIGIFINITDKSYYNSTWGCHQNGNLTNVDYVWIKPPVGLREVTVDATDTTNTNEGSLLEIRCDSGAALPPANIFWSMENSSSSFQLPVSNFNVSRDESTRNKETGSIITTSYLQLTPTRQDSGAKVWCTGQNLDYVIYSRNVTLNVWYRASVTKFEVNGSSNQIGIREEGMLEFRCEVDSNPQATIKIIRMSDKKTLISTTKGTQLVHILHNTSRLTDAGSYACSVSNALYPSEDIRIVQVIVQSGPKITLFLVNNESYESNVTLNETASLKMLCTVDIKTAADVYIESNNKVCQPTQSGYSVLCEISSTSCEENAGIYTCHAKNSVGADSKSLAVFINCIPIVTIKSKGQVTLNVNETATLSATVTAYPAPDVFWTLPNMVLYSAICHTDMETIYLSIKVCNLTVMVTKGHEYGTYKLTAYNVRGSMFIDFAIVDPNHQPPTLNIGLIVGPVAGGLAVIAAIVVASYFLRKRSNSHKGSSTNRTQEGVYEESQMQELQDDIHEYASLSICTESLSRGQKPKSEDLAYTNLEHTQ